LINLVGAIWVSDQWVLFPEPGSTVLYVVGRGLLWYAALYLLLPVTRLVTIAFWNRGIYKRNAVRKELWKEWRQAQTGQTGQVGGEEGGREGGRAGAVYAKMEHAYRCRMEVGVGLGGGCARGGSTGAAAAAAATAGGGNEMPMKTMVPPVVSSSSSSSSYFLSSSSSSQSQSAALV